MKLSMWAINSDRPAKEAPERSAGQDREPDFDLVQPGAMGRRVVEMHVPMARQPLIAPRLVGGQVVKDDVKLAVP